MKDESENSIDRLFKDGLQNGDEGLHHQDNNWEAMENLLEGGKKPAGLLRKLPVIISGLAAMLLLLIGWLFFRPQNVQVTHNKQAKINSVIKKDTGNYGQLTQQPAVHSKIKADTANGRMAADVYNSRERKSFFTLSAVAAGHTTTGFTPHYKAPNGNPVITSGTANGPSVNSVKAASLQPVTLTDTAARGATVASVPALLADTTPPSFKVATATAGTKHRVNANGFKPTFAFSVLASSDLNSVQSFSQNKVGSSAGVTLTMGLTKKWSVTTGALYTNKPYAAPFSAYKTSFKFKTDPTSVDASCLILDIPLNIGYQVYNGGKNKLGLGAGLSSYFMLRESYTFTYPGYGAATSNYTVRNQNRHLFGVANINATYRRKMNSNLDLGIQPYVKLPLTQIGWGQVNLKSAGVAVGVMWNLNSHTKP